MLFKPNIIRPLTRFNGATLYSTMSTNNDNNGLLAKFMRKSLASSSELVLDGTKDCHEAYSSLDSQKRYTNISLMIKEMSLSAGGQYAELLKQISSQEMGLELMIKLREDTQSMLRTRFLKDQDRLGALRLMDSYLKRQLKQDFAVSQLEFLRFSLHSPPNLLNKIIAGEAVHKINSRAELSQRLGKRRRIYGFTHPRMRKSEILAFVQIALTDQVSSNIQSILREDTSTDDQATRTCAIFYSISSTQRGLSGIDLGQSLIKAAVRELQQEFPSLKTFCTLSPIPGLRRWLESVSDKEKLIRELKLPCDSITLLEGYESAPATFAQDDRLAAIFTTLAARYLFHEKRKRQALDPVANFHLRNGACLYRINFAGDSSPKGIAQSYGIMVNYLYDLERLNANQDGYRRSGQVAVANNSIQSLQAATALSLSNSNKI